MTATIILANEKGGVGKTTLSYHLAHYLATKDYSVLAVDLDPQGSLTYTMTGEFSDGVLDVFLRKKSIGNETIRIKNGLGLLGGSKSTGNLRAYLGVMGSHLEALEELPRWAARAGIDYVVIDTSPSPAVHGESGQVLDALNAAALWASDFVLCPVMTEQLSLVGLAAMVKTIRIMQMAHSEVQLLGVIPTMYQRGNKEHPIHLKSMVAQFGPYVFPVVPRNIDVSRAPAYGKPVWEFAENTESAVQFQAIGEKVISYVGKAQAKRPTR